MPMTIVDEFLPEAGKPPALCPDCGPHGNRGIVVLSEALVTCRACTWRADDVAAARIRHLCDAVAPPADVALSKYDISTNIVAPKARADLRWWGEVPEDPWARRVRVRVEWEREP